MNLGQETLSHLVDALPDQFKFYHLGNVELTPASETVETELPDLKRLVEDAQGVAFALQGDIKALMLVVFEKGLDLSTYTELGNILASQLATRLSEEAGLEVLISPPIHLSESHIDMLPKLGSLLIQRTYRHKDGNHIVDVRTLLLASSASHTQTEYGNA